MDGLDQFDPASLFIVCGAAGICGVIRVDARAGSRMTADWVDNLVGTR